MPLSGVIKLLDASDCEWSTARVPRGQLWAGNTVNSAHVPIAHAAQSYSLPSNHGPPLPSP